MTTRVHPSRPFTPAGPRSRGGRTSRTWTCAHTCRGTRAGRGRKACGNQDAKRLLSSVDVNSRRYQTGRSGASPPSRAGATGTHFHGFGRPSHLTRVVSAYPSLIFRVACRDVKRPIRPAATRSSSSCRLPAARAAATRCAVVRPSKDDSLPRALGALHARVSYTPLAALVPTSLMWP